MEHFEKSSSMSWVLVFIEITRHLIKVAKKLQQIN